MGITLDISTQPTQINRIATTPAAVKQAFFKPVVQRQCKHCEEDEKLSRQTASPENTGMTVTSEVENRLKKNRGAGRRLPAGTLDFMGSRFGADFSGVNIHTDSQAVKLSRQLNAQAFTHGRDIYFNEGKFAPGTARGKRLLAHELTHVVQQNGAGERISRIPEEDKIPDRYSYTANCGWIDWGHAQPGLSRDLIARVKGASDALRSAATGGGRIDTPAMQSSVGGVVLSSASFSIQLLRALSDQEVLSVALSIFKRLSVVFETLQEWTDMVGHSSFSQEDLPSNLIGFYRAAMNYSRADIEDHCGLVTPDNPVRRTVSNGRFCGVVDITSSSQEYRRDHDFQRNRTFRPVDAVGAWPAELSSISTAGAETLYEIRTVQAQRGPHNTHQLCPVYRVVGRIGETDWFIISTGGHDFSATDNLRVKPTWRFRPTTHGAYGHTTMIEVVPYGTADETQLRTHGISAPVYVPVNVLQCLSSHSNPI